MSFQEYSESLAGRLHVGKANAKAVAGAIALLVVALAAVAFSLMGSAQGEELPVQKNASDAVAVEDADSATVPVQACVHVGGCVANPGIVYLDEGARVADAIDAAGGMTADAAAEALNLARIVEDGEQLIVPSMVELESTQAAPASGVAVPSGVQLSSSGRSSGKVNLNTASATELQSLSGIGQSKAQKIVDYREANGKFASVDDLTNVSGIGEKTLESIRSQICV